MTTSRESAASDTVLTPVSRHHDTAGRFWPIEVYYLRFEATRSSRTLYSITRGSSGLCHHFYKCYFRVQSPIPKLREQYELAPRNVERQKSC